MRSLLIPGALVLVLAAMPHPAAAEAGLPQGCFCLRHVATDQVLRGCTGFKPPGSYFGHARCTIENGEESTVLLTETWAILAEGAPGCDPCQVGDRPTREVPREEDSQQEDGEPEGGLAVSREGAGPGLGDVVSATSLVLGLITAWLYVTGWTYAYHYFDAFRIPMRIADLPKEHLFVYGGLVVWKNLAASLAVALAVFAAIAGCVHYRSWLGRFGVTTIVVVLVLVMFAFGRLAAIRAADEDFETQRASDYDAYPRVRFALEDTASPDRELLADLAASDCGRLVLATADWLFLIRPIRGAAAAHLDTFAIPRNALKSLRLKADNTSCP